MTPSAETRPVCSCGDTWGQHQASDEGCWGKVCLRLPVARRCQTYAPRSSTQPALVEGQAELLPGATPATPAVLALRPGSFRRTLYDAVARAGARGMTDDELERLLGRSHQSVSAARNGLTSAGHLVDSGQRRDTRYGRPATVWVIRPA